jgi:hypothetical protein
MWIRVDDGAIKRDMREVFHACFVFWSHLNFVSRSGTTWKKGDPLPDVEIPTWVPPDETNLKKKTGVVLRLAGTLFGRK